MVFVRQEEAKRTEHNRNLNISSWEPWELLTRFGYIVVFPFLISFYLFDWTCSLIHVPRSWLYTYGRRGGSRFHVSRSQRHDQTTQKKEDKTSFSTFHKWYRSLNQYSRRDYIIIHASVDANLWSNRFDWLLWFLIPARLELDNITRHAGLFVFWIFVL